VARWLLWSACFALPVALTGCVILQHEPTEVAVERAVAIRASDDATCAILANGNAACWGRNDRGQLGRLPSEGSLGVPTWLPLDADPTDLAVGPYHGCGVFDGAVACWGENAEGLLGGEAGCAETLSDGGCASPPAAVEGLAAQVQVVAAGAELATSSELPRPWSCALGADGRAHCWGDNRRGQLGSAPSDSSATPALVFDAAGFPLRDLVTLSAAGDQACAVDGDGGVWCWGGGATAARKRELPPADKVAVGVGHACVVLRSGAVMCWGDNTNAQAGDEDAAFSCDPEVSCLVGPTLVPQVAGAIDVAVGLVHSCAATAAGLVICWGSNQTLQLGVGNAGLVSGPRVVGLPFEAAAVAAGRMHSCTLGKAGQIWCWGDDGAGQVGVPE
jgi:alpha-tubulin suppressor-like RCC1 family protein